MKCENNWSIRFNDVNDFSFEAFEVKPIQMNLKISRHRYDFCRAKFPTEVGEMMKPETRYQDGRLREMKAVDILYDGKPVQQLMFRRDWAEYGNNFTHIDFKDLHYALDYNTIDQNFTNRSLKDVYEAIFEEDDTGLIGRVNFTLPNSLTVGDKRTEDGDDDKETLFKYFHEEEPDERVNLQGYSSFDFKNKSLHEALREVNNEHELNSWFDERGVLHIGYPSSPGNRHLAAPNDKRVWRYKDPQISHPRNPIKRGVVLGPWIDQQGIGGIGEGLKEAASLFTGGKGAADVRIAGIAERTDISEGRTVTQDKKNIKRDNLKSVATQLLRNRMKEANSGQVGIDPSLSGTQISHPVNVYPGDVVRLVPDDSRFNNGLSENGLIDQDFSGYTSPETGKVGDLPEERTCDSAIVNNEAYSVYEVEHNITQGGHWSVSVDLGMYVDTNIEAKIGFFDPKENEWIEDGETNDNGKLANPDKAIFESR